MSAEYQVHFETEQGKQTMRTGEHTHHRTYQSRVSANQQLQHTRLCSLSIKNTYKSIYHHFPKAMCRYKDVKATWNLDIIPVLRLCHYHLGISILPTSGP